MTPAKSSGIPSPMVHINGVNMEWFMTRRSDGLRSVHIARVSLRDTIRRIRMNSSSLGKRFTRGVSHSCSLLLQISFALRTK